METLLGSEGRADTGNIPRHLKTVFDAIDEGIVIYDAALKLMVWNPAFAAMGIVPDEKLRAGSDILTLYQVLAAAGVFGKGDYQQLAQAQVESIDQYVEPQIELMHVPATGRAMRISRYVLADRSVCLTFNDVTEEIRIEAQLRQTQKMDAIGKLTGGVAHDINNILAVVTGSLELALDKVEDSAVQKLLRTAINASERGAKLTRPLLAFARQQALSPEVVALQELLSNLLDMLQKMLGEKITVALNVAPDLWLCEVDRHQLESVIVNLVVNARDAILPDVGTITITAGNLHLDSHSQEEIPLASGKYIYIAVADDGCGIDPMSQEHVFEPFFTTKDVGQGTGLGLSMAHGFIEQSNGYINLSSELEQGTTFTLYLPAISYQVSNNIDPQVTLDVSANKQKTILVVEDNADLRAIVISQLENLGYQVLFAENGSDAIKVLRSRAVIDLLLTDIIMPDHLNGDELSTIAKTIREDLPVVFMSAYTDNILSKDNLKEGEVAFLQKPFRKSELEIMIANRLQSQHSGSPK